MDTDVYPDGNARTMKKLWIMFKSLTISSPHPSPPELIESSVVKLSTTEEDLMDALCLTQPDDPCIMPAPMETLRPHAKRILSSSTPYACSSIPRGDVLSLLKLILSVQLDKPKWGSHQPYFYTGRILVYPDPEVLQGAADAILRRSTSDEKRDIDWHIFQNVLSIYLVRILGSTNLNRVSLLMTKSKAGLFFTTTSHLHILSFSIDRNRPSSQHSRTSIHHPCPVYSISQPLPPPSTSQPTTPRLRRLRPSRGPLRSPNHSKRVFSFTSHSQYHRPSRRSQPYKDLHTSPHHWRGHCRWRSCPNPGHHRSLHAHAMGHRAKARISSQSASKATPLHTRPPAISIRTMP